MGKARLHWQRHDGDNRFVSNDPVSLTIAGWSWPNSGLSKQLR
jgi:hypothetical protein